MNLLLCRLGLHRWRNHGERVLVIWREPGFVPLTNVWKKKYVFPKRECLRCGKKQRRLFSGSIDEKAVTIVGWETLKEGNRDEKLKP